eukprot:UN04653
MSSTLAAINALLYLYELEESKNNKGNAALLPIDVQKDYYSDTPVIKDTFPDFGKNIASLLLHSRNICNNNNDGLQLELEIIHIRQHDIIDKSVWLPWWRELHPNDKSVATGMDEKFCKVLKNEKLFVKHTFDAFVNTGLNNYLQSKGIETLYVCGLITHACVLNSVMSAFNYGYRIYIIRDCCADRSKDVHNSLLKIFDGYNAKVINLKQFVSNHCYR